MNKHILLALVLLCGCGGQAQNEEKDDTFVPVVQTVGIGDTVSVNYVGSFTNGTVFDTSLQEVAVSAGLPLRPSYSPLTFMVGAGQMIVGFDEAVLDMKVGETKSVTIPPEKAYGPKNPELVMEINMSMFEAHNMTPEIGRELIMTSPQGQMKGEILGFNNTSVIADFNHRLAGETLEFQIALVQLQKVT